MIKFKIKIKNTAERQKKSSKEVFKLYSLQSTRITETFPPQPYKMCVFLAVILHCQNPELKLWCRSEWGIFFFFFCRAETMLSSHIYSNKKHEASNLTRSTGN